MPSKLTENQWWCFLCGFQAGMKIRNLALPDIDSNVTLYPVGIGGETTIGLGMPTLKYDGVHNEGLIPVYTHDVNIPYCGFSVNIKWDSNHMAFLGVEQGDFGTIGDESTTCEIRYNYSNGVFKARALKDNAFNFTEEIILFYIRVRLISPVDNDIDIIFNNHSDSNLEYTTLLTWYINPDVSPDPYTYFITPIKNTNGKILVDKEDSNKNGQPIGDENHIGAPASPSGIYVGVASTPPGAEGVVPVYCNCKEADNFPYNKIVCDLEVDNTQELFEYLEIVGVGDFEVTTTYKVVGNYINLHIEAERKIAQMDAVTFCYINYRISPNVGKYRIPVKCTYAELQYTMS